MFSESAVIIYEGIVMDGNKIICKRYGRGLGAQGPGRHLQGAAIFWLKISFWK